jgi:hypothetical protein
LVCSQAAQRPEAVQADEGGRGLAAGDQFELDMGAALLALQVKIGTAKASF